MSFSITVDDQPVSQSLKVHKYTCNRQNCNCPIIEKCNSARYLGLTVDHHLRWTEHINSITKKVRYITTKFYQLRSILTKRCLLSVYDALVESIIRYCIIVWGGLFNNVLKNLQVTQNTVLKVMFNKSRLHSTSELYAESKLLNIRNIYSHNCLLWIHNNNNYILLENDYSTRAMVNQNIMVPLYKKTHLQRFVFYLAPKLYNTLPLELKTVSNKNKFRKELKTYLQNNPTKFARFF